MFRVNQHRRHAEDLRSSEPVNVVAVAERLNQQRIFREVRQQAQLNLRVISRKQRISRLRNKSRADLAAQLCADGNVL